MTCPADNVIDLAAYRRPAPAGRSAADYLAEAACIIAKHSWSMEPAAADIKKRS